MTGPCPFIVNCWTEWTEATCTRIASVVYAYNHVPKWRELCSSCLLHKHLLMVHPDEHIALCLCAWTFFVCFIRRVYFTHFPLNRTHCLSYRSHLGTVTGILVVLECFRTKLLWPEPVSPLMCFNMKSVPLLTVLSPGVIPSGRLGSKHQTN